MLHSVLPVIRVFAFAFAFTVEGAVAKEAGNRESFAHARLGGETRVLEIQGTDKAAADTLRKYLERSLGKKVSPSTTEPEFTIHVGRTPYVEALKLDFQTLHPFGYRMELVDGRNLVLAGRSPRGNLYAVYDFLKRFAGYRHFGPGALGEIVPRHEVLELPPALDVKEEPSITSYTNAGFYGGNEGFARSWRATLYATHVLGSIVPPEKYGAEHPDYFPMYDGKRYIPGEKQEGTWQPCVSHPDLPRLAIEWAKDYLTKHPEALGFPLGVNDGGGDCRCPECLKAKEKYGNQYLPFYNETARLAKEAFPGKIPAFIAYGGARQAPRSIRPEDNLLVEITGSMVDDLRQMKEWRTAGMENFGLYDYLYGGGYVTPRHYPRLIAKAWRRVAEEYGMRSFWGESFIKSWYFDGPRQYVVNELAWDLDAPVEDLLRDYFTSFYGPAAAPMQAVFDRFEEIHMRGKDPLYLWNSWRQWGQLEGFTASDLEYIRGHLREAASLAGEGDHARRVALFGKLWSLSELFIRTYLAVERMEALEGGSREWEGIVAEGLVAARAIEAFSLSPEDEKAIFCHEGLAEYKGMEKLKMRPKMEIAVDRFFRRTEAALGEKADAFLQAEAGRAASAEARFFAECHMLEKKGSGTFTDLFAPKKDAPPIRPESTTLPGWTSWRFPNSATTFGLSAEGTPDGSPAMVIHQNDIAGGFLRGHTALPGERYRIRFMVKQTAGAKPGNPLIRWKDGKGKWLPERGAGSQSPVALPCPAPDGNWHEVSVPFTVPEGARSISVLLQAPVQPASSAIRFHGVSLYKVHEMPQGR